MNAATLGSLGISLRNLLSEYGCGIYAYRSGLGRAADLETSTFTNFPRAWAEHYGQNEYVTIDPLVAHARKSLRPATWNQIKRPLKRMTPQRAIFDEVTEFGVRSGAVIPIHGPSPGYAAFSFCSELKSRDFEDIWLERWPELHALALLLHERAELLTTSQCEPGAKPLLSPRERECLLWASAGKTAWETAQILGLRYETVSGYLKTAARKLGTVSKTQAVVKAILIGEIRP